MHADPTDAPGSGRASGRATEVRPSSSATHHQRHHSRSSADRRSRSGSQHHDRHESVDRVRSGSSYACRHEVQLSPVAPQQTEKRTITVIPSPPRPAEMNDLAGVTGPADSAALADSAGVTGPTDSTHPPDSAGDDSARGDWSAAQGTPAGTSPVARQDTSMVSDVSSLMFPSLPRSINQCVSVDSHATKDGLGYGSSRHPVQAR